MAASAQSPAASQLRLLALRVLFGARNGALYGVKVRGPHSLVLTSLWHEGDAKTKARVILAATATHAKQLALFASAYKVMFYTLGAAAGVPVLGTACGHSGSAVSGRSSAVWRAGAAGALAGGLVFREHTPVNVQVVLFLFSRTVLGAVKKAASGHVSQRVKAWGWPLFAAATWGSVMTLWELDKHVLASGLLASMDFIYEDHDASRSWAELLSQTAWRAALAKR